MPRLRLLLMGSHAVGKTVMRKMLFENRQSHDFSSTECTEDAEQLLIPYSDYWNVHLIDCKQRKDFRPYNFSEDGNFFHQCAFLVFVVDVYATQEVIEEDFNHYINCLKKLHEKAPNAKVFVMLHKKQEATLINVAPSKVPWKTDEEYEELEKKYQEGTKGVGNFKNELKVYRTNIENLSHHAAWSDLLTAVEPSMNSHFKERFKTLLNEWLVNELVLLEGHSLLCIAQADNGKHKDPDRTQKLATTFKKFVDSEVKRGQRRSSCKFHGRMATFQIIIEPFHRCTFLVVVTSNNEDSPDALISKINELKVMYDRDYPCPIRNDSEF